MKTLIYNPNSIYELKLDFRHQSRIEFARNEKVRIIAMGDHSNWNINPHDNMIFIRPLTVKANTNLMVITNKHVYTFDLVALESIAIPDIAYVTRFFYPDSESNNKLLSDQLKSTPLLMENKKTNHNYTFYGDDNISPKEVFDDGSLTFFKFKNKSIPKIFIIKDNGEEYATDMLSYKDYIVIHGTYRKLALRYQNQKVIITKGEF